MYVTDPHQGAAFDTVFTEVFGGAGAGRTSSPTSAHTAERSDEHRRRPAGRLDLRAAVRQLVVAAERARRRPDADEVEVPLAIASDEERLAGKSFDALRRPSWPSSTG